MMTAAREPAEPKHGWFRGTSDDYSNAETTACANSRGANQHIGYTPTTSFTGQTADQRNSRTSSRCATSTTTALTKAAGTSPSPTTAGSSTTPTATNTTSHYSACPPRHRSPKQTATSQAPENEPTWHSPSMSSPSTPSSKNNDDSKPNNSQPTKRSRGTVSMTGPAMAACASWRCGPRYTPRRRLG